MDTTIMDQNKIMSEEPQNNKLPRITRRKLIIISVSVAVVAILVWLQYSKGAFVAATVNGSPITRLAVIGELEKQSGKQALDSLVTKKLVENETRNISVSQDDINNEIKKIEQQVVSQGGTLDAALKQQGMSRKQLQEQVTLQKKIKKLLVDKFQISDEELNTYIKDQKIAPSKGQKLEDFKVQLKEQLQQQKFSQIVQQWIGDLKTKAKIKYYVGY